MSAPAAAVEPAIDVLAIVADIRQRLTEAEAAVARIATNVDNALSGLPDFLGGGLRDAVAQLRQVFDETVGLILDPLAYVGDPVALQNAGQAWATDIGGTTGSLAGVSSLNGDKVDDFWTGMAADAYKNTLPAQAMALTAIKAAGDELSSTLTELANAIGRFWIAIGEALLSFVIGIGTAVAATETTIGIPVGVSLGLTVAAGLGVGIKSAYSALVDITTDTATRATALGNRLANDVAFPRGAWPRSATPISSDASITDGDDTDWHLK
jgi:uncharacterized protein YukE